MNRYIYFENSYWSIAVLQRFVTFYYTAKYDPMDCSPPGSSVNGISQSRILEWVAIPSPGDLQNQGSNLHLLHWQADSLPLSHQGSPGEYKPHFESFWWLRKSLMLKIFLKSYSITRASTHPTEMKTFCKGRQHNSKLQIISTYYFSNNIKHIMRNSQVRHHTHLDDY